jgi:hypothetical protein
MASSETAWEGARLAWEAAIDVATGERAGAA